MFMTIMMMMMSWMGSFLIFLRNILFWNSLPSLMAGNVNSKAEILSSLNIQGGAEVRRISDPDCSKTESWPYRVGKVG